jgi:hypothetical protein
MAIPGLSGMDAAQIRQLIQQLKGLLSPQGLGAPGSQGNQGCCGNEQQEFQDIVDQIRLLSNQLDGLESGRYGNADGGNGRLNVRISV